MTSSKIFSSTSCSTVDVYRAGDVSATRKKYIFQINLFDSQNERTRKLTTINNPTELEGRRVYTSDGIGISLIRRQNFRYAVGSGGPIALSRSRFPEKSIRTTTIFLNRLLGENANTIPQAGCGYVGITVPKISMRRLEGKYIGALTYTAFRSAKIAGCSFRRYRYISSGVLQTHTVIPKLKINSRSVLKQDNKFIPGQFSVDAQKEWILKTGPIRYDRYSLYANSSPDLKLIVVAVRHQDLKIFRQKMQRHILRHIHQKYGIKPSLFRDSFKGCHCNHEY